MNKLQELTDKLYNEGLSKGREEGERILEEARRQAEDIIAKARQEAEGIISDAHRQAEDYRQKVSSDLKMASAQSLQATKKDIENLIIGSFAGEEVKKSLSSPDFVKEILKSVAQKFSSEESASEFSSVSSVRLLCMASNRFFSSSSCLRDSSLRRTAKKLSQMMKTKVDG